MSRIVLGIDPGTSVTGYGVVQEREGALAALDYGCIRPPRTLALPDRYFIIFSGIEELIRQHKPAFVAVETQYVRQNPQSALKLGMAKGAVLIAARKHALPIHEYAPNKAKLAVTGNGRASKVQVQEMTRQILGLSAVPQPEDAADALALAICLLSAHKDGIKIK